MNYDDQVLGTGNPNHPANEQPYKNSLDYNEAMEDVSDLCTFATFEAISNENNSLHNAISERNRVITQLQDKINKIKSISKQIYDIESFPMQEWDDIEVLRQLKKELLTILNIETE